MIHEKWDFQQVNFLTISLSVYRSQIYFISAIKNLARLPRLHLTSCDKSEPIHKLWIFDEVGVKKGDTIIRSSSVLFTNSLSHALETSGRSYSGWTRLVLPFLPLKLVRAHGTCVSCLIANAPGGLWDAGMTKWQSSEFFSLPFLLFLSFSQVRPFRRLRGHCVIRRINLGPSGDHEWNREAWKRLYEKS